ncbi:MAG TPA: hypothetical protein VGK29_19350 [Paludibaculum sp.]|jgi:hypothetical protein
MATHVRILAWLNIALGALGVLAALVVFAGAQIIPAILTHTGGEEAAIPVAIIQMIVTIVMSIILVMSLPCLVLGFGLHNFRPWARILGLVLAAVNLLNLPFGTAISLYGFWVLLKPETEALFTAGAASRGIA